MKETWFHFSTFEFGSKWFIWFEINNDLQLPFCHNFQHVTSLMVSHVQYFPFFLLSQSLKCALNKLGLHSIDRIFQPEVCHNPDISESTQIEALRDFAMICQVAAWYLWWTWPIEHRLLCFSFFLEGWHTANHFALWVLCAKYGGHWYIRSSYSHPNLFLTQKQSWQTAC